jgi:hypothetical protein
MPISFSLHSLAISKKIVILYTISETKKQVSSMKHLLFKINGLFVAILSMMTICLSSCERDGLTGREYQGDYHSNSIERIYIEFEANSKVVGVISSADFVGHFSDRLYGNYEYKHPYISITWTSIDSDNDVYKSLGSSPDSIIVNESLDTLRLYEGNEKYVLPKYQLYQIDETASFYEQLGQYCGQTIFLILVFIIKNFITIVIVVIVLIIARKWWKRRKK